MNLGKIIEFTDGIKPNAFQPEDKVAWINELERLIQTDVLRLAEGLTDHVWSSTWSGPGIYFPDSATMVIPAAFEARAGGLVDIEDLEDYADNNGAGLVVVSSSGEDGVTTLTFPAGTFQVTGETGESGTAKIYYDGAAEPMVAPEMWEKIYYTYLEARIDAASGEWGEYANAMQLYNSFMSDYVRWYCRNFIDD